MKKMILSGAMLLISTIGFGQCDQNAILKSSQTIYLDSNGNIQRTENEESTIKISPSKVVIMPGNSGTEMIGTIDSTSCKWTEPYKDGKTVITAVFDDPSGGKRHATLTTEGSHGKLTFTMVIAEMPDRVIRANVYSFQQERE
jgi:hypothetical protein